NRMPASGAVAVSAVLPKAAVAADLFLRLGRERDPRVPLSSRPRASPWSAPPVLAQTERKPRSTMQKGSTTLWRALFDCVFCAFRPLPPRPLTVLKIGNPSVSCQGKIVATSKRGKPGSVVASICTSRKYRLCDLQGFLLYLFQVILGM